MLNIRITLSVRGKTMSKVKPYKHVRSILLKAGWILDHTTGFHEIYTKDGISCPVKCTKKDIPAGTVSNVERITGLKF